jgi:hypothetical protein
VFHYANPRGLATLPALLEAAEARDMRLVMFARPDYERIVDGDEQRRRAIHLATNGPDTPPT